MLSISSALLISNAMAAVICLYTLTTMTDAKIKYGIITEYIFLSASIVGLIQIDRLTVLITEYMNKPSAKEYKAFYNFLAQNVVKKNAIKINGMLFMPAEAMATVLKDYTQTTEGCITASQTKPATTQDNVPTVSSESSQSGASSFTMESDKDAPASDDARSAATTI